MKNKHNTKRCNKDTIENKVIMHRKKPSSQAAFVLVVSQLKINPLLCRGREDLQIKANSRDKIKVGLQNHK